MTTFPRAMAASLSLVLFGVACGVGQTKEAPRAPTLAISRAHDTSSLHELFTEHCASCHTGSGKAPRLSTESLTSDKRLAMRAALFVSAYRMPPPPDRLDRDERLAVLKALCDAGAADPTMCVSWLGFRNTEVRLVGTTPYLRAVEAMAPLPGDGGKSEESHAEWLLRMQDHQPLTLRIMRNDTTAEVLRAFIASDRCPAPPAAAVLPGTTAVPTPFEVCAASLLNDELYGFPEAAKADAGSAGSSIR